MTRIRFEDLPSTNTPRNAENLNKLNNVVISPTEPTTGEEIWIQKAKNLFDGTKNSGLLDDNGVIIANNDWFTSNFIKVSGSKKYTLSFDSTSNQQWKVCYYTKDNTFISFQYGNISGNSVIDLTTPSNCSKLRFAMRETLNHSNIQLEQGDKTTYEPYTPKKIYTKNDNGVYEEFYDETNLEVYSTNEQRIGIWIDGKPLYKRVLFLTSPELNTSVYHGIENIKEIVDISGSVNIAGEYKPTTSVYVDNDNIYGRFSFSIYRFTVDFIYLSAGSYFTENKNNLKVRVIVKYTKTTD